MAREHRTAIVVAVLGLIGVLGGAIINNWEKVAGLLRNLNPPPTSGSFQNFELNNGTPGNGALESYCRNIWLVLCKFEPTIVHTGMRSIYVKVPKHSEPDQTGGAVRIFSSKKSINLSSAISISVWLYDTQGSNTVQLKLCNGDNCPDEIWSAMTSTKDEWTEIVWLISSFKNVDKHNITGIELYEWNDGVYYFDDISWQ